jgi:hypothetical protein
MALCWLPIGQKSQQVQRDRMIVRRTIQSVALRFRDPRHRENATRNAVDREIRRSVQEPHFDDRRDIAEARGIEHREPARGLPELLAKTA